MKSRMASRLWLVFFCILWVLSVIPAQAQSSAPQAVVLTFRGPITPVLVEYLERYSAEQMRRHDVLPGLTGWAQINGRNAISWQEKFRLDVWYVDHWSFWLDLKIIFLTVWKVIRREGISQPGQATTQYFTGNPPEER